MEQICQYYYLAILVFTWRLDSLSSSHMPHHDACTRKALSVAHVTLQRLGRNDSLIQLGTQLLQGQGPMHVASGVLILVHFCQFLFIEGC